jgi:hypothetical protein
MKHILDLVSEVVECARTTHEILNMTDAPRYTAVIAHFHYIQLLIHEYFLHLFRTPCLRTPFCMRRS